MQTLKIALDWTPNTNHTGFFVAQTEGYYQRKGLDVQIIHPAQDNYEVTPAKKLERDEVDLAITPTESILSYRFKENPAHFIAIAALLQSDTSAIVTLANSGIERPAQLDGKTYASYQARYEDAIVQQMVRNDGGTGDLKISYPNKLGIWNTLLEEQADATWIFRAWEGQEAQQRGVLLNYFLLENYGIPYGYSPVLITKQERITAEKETLQNFLAATREGFRLAIDNPEKAAAILTPSVPERDRMHINITESQRFINDFYTRLGQWGRMEKEVWQRFLDWLHQYHLIETKVEPEKLFTNALLTDE